MINKYSLIKVIKKILREGGGFGIREVARNTSVSVSSVKEALDFLLSQNILEKKQVGRGYLFNIKDNFLTRSIKILYSLTEINSSGIVQEIIKKNPEILSIILYGSVAKGKDDNNSDIDLLIISRKKTRIPVLQSERLLSREISITSYTYNQWREKAEKDRTFYYNVILDCIQLFGEKPVVI